MLILIVVCVELEGMKERKGSEVEGGGNEVLWYGGGVVIR